MTVVRMRLYDGHNDLLADLPEVYRVRSDVDVNATHWNVVFRGPYVKAGRVDYFVLVFDGEEMRPVQLSYDYDIPEHSSKEVVVRALNMKDPPEILRI